MKAKGLEGRTAVLKLRRADFSALSRQVKLEEPSQLADTLFRATQALLMVAVVYGLGQMLESFVLTPRLVGERIGLHPLVVILALMAFGQLLGFVGVLIALPASAVLLVALRRLRQTYMASALYRHGPSGPDSGMDA